jgi:aspartyl-tRNA(Asn)/glutamyl-tRNA(Gln) amidotransferase subunit B
MKYQQIIGLEVHVELETESKMFCRCSASHFGVEPNTHTCPVCLGLPGALPLVNKRASEFCLKIGLALQCELLDTAIFARKHYSYPDLAKGYQISQYELPFCVNGWIEINGRKIRVKRVHMEEDTGKLQHSDLDNKSVSLVDFNRAGVPLVEIVTEPDFRSADEVEEYAKKLQQLMRYLNVSSADMDKGSMRFEANTSAFKSDKDFSNELIEEKDLPKYKVEVKNLNSFKALTGAIKYEFKRQTEQLEEGKIPAQETCGWDDIKQKTYSQRDKEDAHDYRYFPDPDISPMNWMKQEEEKLKAEMPELPWQKKHKYISEYGLSDYDASLLTNEKEVAAYFESGIQKISETTKTRELAKKLTNWINGELARLRNEHNTSISQLKFTASDILEIINLIESGKVSGTNAKIVFEELFTNGGEPSKILIDKGLEQSTDSKASEEAVRKVIAEQPKAVTDYKNGKVTVIQFLIGMAMKELKGKGNTEEIKALLEKNL